MILVALALMVFANVSGWALEMFKSSAGVIWGLATAIAAIYCRIRASRSIATNKKYLLWLAIPGVLAFIPIAYHVHRFFRSDENTWLMRCWDVSPIIIGFVVPVVLLWMAYSSLEKHSISAVDSDKSLSGQ